MSEQGGEELDLSTEAAPGLDAAAALAARKAEEADAAANAPLPSLEKESAKVEARLALLDEINTSATRCETLLFKEAEDLDRAKNVGRRMWSPRSRAFPDYTVDTEGQREYPYVLVYDRNKEGDDWLLTPTLYEQGLEKGGKIVGPNGKHPDIPRLAITLDGGKITAVSIEWNFNGTSNGGDPFSTYDITGLGETPALRRMFDTPEFTDLHYGGVQKLSMEVGDREHPKLVYTTDRKIAEPRIGRAIYTFDESKGFFVATSLGSDTIPSTRDEGKRERYANLTIDPKAYADSFTEALSLIPAKPQ